MLSRVVGHQPLRDRLRAHQGSFALVGPPGVGKSGVVTEWISGRPCQQAPPPLERCSTSPLSEVASPPEAARAARSAQTILIMDATKVVSWGGMLPLLEEHPCVVITSDCELPPAVTSRIPVFRAGYLSDTEVTQILAENFPRLSPRPLIASLARGSLADLDTISAAAGLRDVLDAALSARHSPDLHKHDPLALLTCLRSACCAVLRLPALPFTDTARSAISTALAHELLATPRLSKAEARNVLALFFRRLLGG